MRRDLQRYLSSNPHVEIIYQDRSGKFTKRRIRLLAIQDDRVKAYCFIRRGPRSFVIENILAVQPVMKRAV